MIKRMILGSDGRAELDRMSPQLFQTYVDVPFTAPLLRMPTINGGPRGRYLLDEKNLFSLMVGMVAVRTGLTRKESALVTSEVRTRWDGYDTRGGPGHADLYEKKMLLTKYNFRDGYTGLNSPKVVDRPDPVTGPGVIVIDLKPISDRMTEIFELCAMDYDLEAKAFVIPA